MMYIRKCQDGCFYESQSRRYSKCPRGLSPSHDALIMTLLSDNVQTVSPSVPKEL